MQNLAWSASLALMVCITALFCWVAAGASRATTAIGDGQISASRWRTRAFWIMVVVGSALSYFTLRSWPIVGHASEALHPDVIINAIGHQFSWQLDKNEVTAGQLVEFRLTSADVNHGFAIYKGKLGLLAQGQAMPGYVNKLQYRFDEPGDYEVLCLEYCGIAHHGMRAVIKVRDVN